jgi:hypothetical protein
VGQECGVEDDLTVVSDASPGTIMDRSRRIEADSGMAMLGVIVGKEFVTEFSGIVDAGEVFRECWAVF